MEYITNAWNWVLEKTHLNDPQTRQIVFSSGMFAITAALMHFYGRALFEVGEQKLPDFDEDAFFERANKITMMMQQEQQQ